MIGRPGVLRHPEMRLTNLLISSPLLIPKLIQTDYLAIVSNNIESEGSLMIS